MSSTMRPELLLALSTTVSRHLWRDTVGDVTLSAVLERRRCPQNGGTVGTPVVA